MKEYYLRFIRPYLKYYIIGPCFMMVEVFGDILLPWMLSRIINIGVARHNVQYIVHYGIMMVVITVLMAIGGVGGAFFASKAAMYTGADLRMALFEKIQQFSFQNIDDFSTGSLITRLTNDITQIQNMTMQALRTCLRSPGILVGAVVMSFLMSPEMTVILLVVIPLIIAVVALIMKLAFPRFDIMQGALDRLNTCIQEGLANIRVIKSFVRDDYEEAKFEERSIGLKDATLKAMNTVIYMAPLMTLLMDIAVVAVVWRGGSMIIAGFAPVGNLMAFINYMTKILQCLTMLSMVFLNSTRAVASFKRVGEVMRTKVDLTDEAALQKNKCVGSGTVEFQHVFFRYYKNTSEWVLSDINFKIDGGKTLGIIGSTGCGKSTLAALLDRLYDVDRGAIYLDGTDVRDYSLENLRGAIGMVLQNSVLFSGNIHDNLAWGDENASEEDIIAAARCAAADDFVQNFAQGYASELGQGGNNVSGGQKQRLCIARALVRKPKVLILDDSTSAVDTATEYKIRTALRTQYRDTTKIIISQRVVSIMDADCILVMDSGEIVAQGTHSELLQICEMYRDIYESQNMQDDAEKERAARQGSGMRSDSGIAEGRDEVCRQPIYQG